MLTPALTLGRTITPHGPTCLSTRPPSGNAAVPRLLMHHTQRCEKTVARQPPPQRGGPSSRFTRPQGFTRCSKLTSLNPASDPSTFGRIESEAPAMAGGSSAGPAQVYILDRRQGLCGPRVGSVPASRVPQHREPSLAPGTALESDVSRRKVGSSFWSVWLDRHAPSCGRPWTGLPISGYTVP